MGENRRYFFINLRSQIIANRFYYVYKGKRPNEVFNSHLEDDSNKYRNRGEQSSSSRDANGLCNSNVKIDAANEQGYIKNRKTQMSSNKLIRIRSERYKPMFFNYKFNDGRDYDSKLFVSDTDTQSTPNQKWEQYIEYTSSRTLKLSNFDNYVDKLDGGVSQHEGDEGVVETLELEPNPKHTGYSLQEIKEKKEKYFKGIPRRIFYKQYK